MVNLNENHLLFIEPEGLTKVPVWDGLCEKMARAVAETTASEGRTRGFHVCACGVASSNTVYHVRGRGRDGISMVTNSLALHYLVVHRDEVPESEFEKVNRL